MEREELQGLDMLYSGGSRTVSPANPMISPREVFSSALPEQRRATITSSGSCWSSANRLGKHVCIMHKPCKCAHAYCTCTCGHYMFTSSGARTAAAGLEAAEERLRSAESWEAAAESLGPAAGCEAAAENLGPTGGLETAAAYELDLITAGEAAAQQGSGSSAAVATAGSGASAGAATSDAAIVAAAALDAAAATSHAGSIAFERITSALASASSFWTKRTPSASTALTGPVRPGTVVRLALGWAHASAKVRGLVITSACSDL